MSDSAFVSPFAPQQYPPMPAITGLHARACAAGIKSTDRKDLLLIAFDEPARVAGVFTRSRCPSAAVDWCRQRLSRGHARGLVVNSGNANAFTGARGETAALQTAQAAAGALKCSVDDILLASTGVIGEPMDTSQFAALLQDLARPNGPPDWLDAAMAITTTDTFAKMATRQVRIDGQSYVINGIAKGSGMIAPDMATMLAFIFTDAPLSGVAMQGMLDRLVPISFNAITVDGDTSTSDTVLLFSLGRGASLVPEGGAVPAAFEAALAGVMCELAQSIVKDGEGARKFISIHVHGAVDDRSARRIGLSIGNSPLVKTAIAGEDANWGRIVMAIGKAGEPADRDRLAIWFGDAPAAVDGERHPEYSEDRMAAIMGDSNIDIRVDLGLGDGHATIWTCDLTQRYVSINGDYRS